ncbi:MAG TPA: hypothetical protein VFS88_08615 [Micavibrio sp.]|nr:hypothetical protein [Micavibrio sp.]
MNQKDFEMVCKRVKDAMRGVSPQQVGDMKIEEKEKGGCDLIIQYTRAPRLTEGVQTRTMGIFFNNAAEADYARYVLRYGEADLDAPSEKTPVRGLEKSFDINL